MALRDQSELAASLDRLAGALERLDLGPAASRMATDRQRIAIAVRSHLIPRMTDPAAPMVVVFAGPTGSGKSTLINTVTRLDISETGPIRPTTRNPVVLASNTTATDYSSIGGVGCDVVTGSAPILETMTLVDAPDIDSTETEHRATAEILLDNADVVVFVTSALRYSDLVPWQVLRRAVERGTPVIQVLNRVSSATTGAIVDFRSRLIQEGLDDDVITVSEHHVGSAGRVPPLAARALSRRLALLAVGRAESADRIFARVLRAQLDQTAQLIQSVGRLREDHDDFEAEISIQLSGRVTRLDLGGVGRGLHEDPPVAATRRSVRHWIKANREDDASVAHKHEVVAERVITLIHTDLLHWLSSEAQASHDVDPTRVLSETSAVASRAIAGWIDLVRRITEEHDIRPRSLGELALIDAATRDEGLRSVFLLLGDESSALVDQARRDLKGRIEVVYAYVEQVVVEARRAQYGDPDESDLRAALDALSSIVAHA